MNLRAFASLSLALAVVGCVHRYEEPPIDQPHALVKIRTVHHERSGPSLDLDVRITVDQEEYGVAMPGEDSIRAIRVRPVPTGYRMRSAFFHTITQMRTVFVSEQYQCGTTSSYSGGRTSSQPRYCTRQVPRQRMETVRIGDGSCEASGWQLDPLAGAVYLVQYDYFGPDVCSVSCMRQLDTGGGTFQFVPCGAGEPPVYPTSGGEAYQLGAATPPLMVPAPAQ